MTWALSMICPETPTNSKKDHRTECGKTSLPMKTARNSTPTTVTCTNGTPSKTDSNKNSAAWNSSVITGGPVITTGTVNTVLGTIGAGRNPNTTGETGKAMMNLGCSPWIPVNSLIEWEPSTAPLKKWILRWTGLTSKSKVTTWWMNF